MKTQVIVIHGGDTFETYEEYIAFLKAFEVDLEYVKKKGWKESLQTELGEAYEVIRLQMPNKANAKYLEWKIWFDKFVPLFNKEVILVGHSLGGIFLAKYLSENKINKTIKATFLIAPPFDAEEAEYTLADFILPHDLSMFAEQSGAIFVYHSKDDPVVPFADMKKFLNMLPQATSRIFEDRGHFGQESLPELVEDIKALYLL